jgi:hypothetical protein
VNDDEHHEDTPNLDIEDEPRGPLHLMDPNRIFLEDNASESFGPSVTKRIFRASAAFSFLVLVGVGGAVAWRFGGDQATDMIRAWAPPGTTSKPTAPPEGFAELQQQLKSIAIDLAAVKRSLEQQSAANKDQLTRIQEQIAQQSIALHATKQELSQKLSSSLPADKPVHVAKPAQHPAQPSAQESSKAIHVAPPQSLLPPKQ